jgi:RNA polymerase sigma factor (sigma-70 family)
MDFETKPIKEREAEEIARKLSNLYSTKSIKKEDREDLYSICMLKYYTILPKINPEKNSIAYVKKCMKMAIFQHLNYLKKNRYTDIDSIKDTVIIEPEDLLITKLDSEKLIKKLRPYLKKKERILLSNLLESKNLPEVAKRCNISYGSLRVNTFRLRKKAAIILKDIYLD